ncbi:SRPBCC family protein [Solimonas variicoloris]|uniref:SRPBCC family protein n=1 Tax=Solimonas variicoloris TaxID=254408 RepID=UPI00035D7F0A|nr:SRPBCC family protein [Solimonas variicoloris]
MITVASSICVRRPTDEVFAYAGDYRNDAHWRSGVTAMRCEPDVEPALGVQTHETMQMLGLRAETLAEIIAWEPGRRTAFRSISGPVPCEGRRLFEATPDGTRVTYQLHLLPQGRWRLLAPLLALLFSVQVFADLRRLRRRIEAPILHAA